MSFHDGNDLRRLGQASRPRRTTGKLSHTGRNDMHTARRKTRNILLRDRILPHPRIHCGCDIACCSRRKDACRQHIIGDARRRLCDEVRRRGRDEKKLRELRERDVLNVVMRLPPHRLCDGLSRDLAERERRDKGGRCPRHDAAHICARFLQPTCDLDRLVCGNAARHAEDNAPPCECAHVRRSLCRGHS